MGLVLPKHTELFIIEAVDTVERHAGILLQKDESGKERPVACTSTLCSRGCAPIRKLRVLLGQYNSACVSGVNL